LDQKSLQLNKFWYKISRIIIWIFFRLNIFVKIKIEKLEEIPETGAAVIASSHKHWLDILLLCLINPRNIHYVAKRELYKNKLAAWYFDVTGCIPIQRDEIDIEAFAKIIEILKDEEIIGIFPEGTRNKGDGIKELKRGIAFMLLKNKIYPPIYPIVITYKKGKLIGLPLKINIIIGRKIDASKYSKSKVLTEEIYKKLIDLYIKSTK